MAGYRLECALGRFSVVGTTIRQAALPAHLLADEHHPSLDGKKVDIAPTVGAGCLLGAEPATTAGPTTWRPPMGSSKRRPVTSSRGTPPGP
jgi:hypothetical protein